MSTQVKEDLLGDYNGRIATSLGEPSLWVRAARTSGPTARFRRRSNRAWEALDHPGYTVITPTFEDETNPKNTATYVRLCDVQRALLDKMGSSKLAPAPNSAFHLTVADLIADLPFRRRVRSDVREARFRGCVKDILEKFQDSWPGALPTFEVAGLSLFEAGFVVALVRAHADSAPGYIRLMSFRDHIYGGALKTDYSVDRIFPFTGHVTVAYIEDVLVRAERDQLAEVLLDLNGTLKDTSLPLVVEVAELRKFDGMQRFYRDPSWPVYRFA